jgi:hypothetical protein
LGYGRNSVGFLLGLYLSKYQCHLIGPGAHQMDGFFPLPGAASGGMTGSGCPHWKISRLSRNGSGSLDIRGNWSRPRGRYGKRSPAIRRKKYGPSSCGSGRPYPVRQPWEGS